MSTNLVPLSAEQYPALNADNPTLAALREMLADEPLGPEHLPRISTPGGLKQNEKPKWALPGDKIVASFDGVLIHTHVHRVRWDPSVGLGEAPPLCSSCDGRTGAGDPGGECINCPLARFGPKQNGRGTPPGCQKRRVNVMLVQGVPLPLLYDASPTNAPRITNYLTRDVIYRPGPNGPEIPPRYFEVVTRFGLGVASGSKGPYGALALEYVATLDPATCEEMRRQNASLAEPMLAYQARAEDVAEV
jgi:hypothetical protein